MRKYNPEKDYCGPEGLDISRLIPRRLFGVDINRCCFRHDLGWSDGDGHTAADKAFRADIRRTYRVEGKPVAGWFVSWLYYSAVRVGRLWLWLKGVR